MGLAVFVGLGVARYLGPEQYGNLNYTLALIAMLGPLGELGLDSVLRREFVRNPESSATLAGTAIRIRLIGGILALAIAVSYSLLAETAGPGRRLLLILALTLLLPSFIVPESWLQSRLESRKSAVPQWIALGGGAIWRIIAIIAHAPIELFAAAVVFEQALGAALVYRSARNEGLGIAPLSGSVARRLFAECWPLALSSASVMIYMRIDIVMLHRMMGKAIAGNYAAAVRLSELAYFIPMIAAMSVQPKLVQAHQKGSGLYRQQIMRYFDLSAFSAYAITIPMVVFAPVLVAYAYGSMYTMAASALSIHAWAMVFVFLGVARSQCLINAGLTRFSLISTFVGAATNVLLNLSLIPRWGANGAAWATVVAQAIAAIGTTLCYPPAREFAALQINALLLRSLWSRNIDNTNP